MLPIIDATGTTTWVPAAAKREPFSFKNDEDLSWEEFTIAAPRMLLAFQHAKWPESRITMFSEFWGNILRHQFRLSDDPLDVKTLLVYQAEQRRDWHHAILAPNGAWNRTARDRADKELRAQWESRMNSLLPNTPTRPPLLHGRAEGINPSPRTSPRYNAIPERGPPGARGGFREGSGDAYPPCAVCLGRHEHKVAECCATRTADGAFPTASRRKDRKLVLHSGQPLCYRWQGPASCTSSRHDDQHICSGCGQSSHGLASCSRLPSAHSV